MEHNVKKTVDSANAKYFNDTIKTMCERGSTRVFSDKPVEPEIIEQLEMAVANSPTGGNLQPVTAILVQEKKTLEKIVALGNQGFISKAPAGILFCLDMNRTEQWCKVEKAPFTMNRSFRNFWISMMDTMIAAQTFNTAVESLGLGAVYIGTVTEFWLELKEIFELPDKVLPVIYIAFGYPAKEIKVSQKYPSHIVFHREKYQRPTDEELEAALNKKFAGAEFPVMEGDKRLETLRAVIDDAIGSDFADECVEYAKSSGFFTMAQARFGLHYRANSMPLGNREFFEDLEKLGFFPHIPFRQNEE